MELKSVDAALLQKAVLAAAKGLEAKKEWINELNVFPVPDGDTGTNMTMTIMAAAREVAAIENNGTACVPAYKPWPDGSCTKTNGILST